MWATKASLHQGTPKFFFLQNVVLHCTLVTDQSKWRLLWILMTKIHRWTLIRIVWQVSNRRTKWNLIWKESLGVQIILDFSTNFLANSNPNNLPKLWRYILAFLKFFQQFFFCTYILGCCKNDQFPMCGS